MSKTVFVFFLILSGFQNIWMQSLPLRFVWAHDRGPEYYRAIPLYVEQGLSTQLHRTGQQFRWSQVLGSETEICV